MSNRHALMTMQNFQVGCKFWDSRGPHTRLLRKSIYASHWACTIINGSMKTTISFSKKLLVYHSKVLVLSNSLRFIFLLFSDHAYSRTFPWPKGTFFLLQESFGNLFFSKYLGRIWPNFAEGQTFNFHKFEIHFRSMA